jgi:hypothetical protein
MHARAASMRMPCSQKIMHAWWRGRHARRIRIQLYNTAVSYALILASPPRTAVLSTMPLADRLRFRGDSKKRWKTAPPAAFCNIDRSARTRSAITADGRPTSPDPQTWICSKLTGRGCKNPAWTSSVRRTLRLGHCFTYPRGAPWQTHAILALHTNPPYKRSTALSELNRAMQYKNSIHDMHVK